MNFIEILKICAEILGLQFSDEFYHNTDELASDGNVRRLIRCADSVLDELYREYSPLNRKTVVEAVNGLIATDELKLVKVVYLKDSCGNSVPFSYSSGGLAVSQDGKYNLGYVHKPDAVTAESEIKLPTPRITARIFVYGVVAEFYAETGDLTLSNLWRDKYVSALQVIELGSVRGIMPVRGWL